MLYIVYDSKVMHAFVTDWEQGLCEGDTMETYDGSLADAVRMLEAIGRTVHVDLDNPEQA